MRLDGRLYVFQTDVVVRRVGSQGPVVQVDDVLHALDEAVQPLLAVVEQDRAPIEVALADLVDGFPEVRMRGVREDSLLPVTTRKPQNVLLAC